MITLDFRAELRDIDLARIVIGRSGGQFVARVEQVDSYFAVGDGRLKRRRARGEPDEWVHYVRSDRSRPRMSHFKLYTVEEAAATWSGAGLAPRAQTRKVREVYLLGSALVHLDEVEGLGRYLDAKAQVTPGHDLRRCHAVMDELRGLLGVALGEAVGGSYADYAAGWAA